jgi:hypothetical protein
LNQLLFAAEESLQQLETCKHASRAARPAFVPAAAPDSVVDVATALHQMRELVGAHDD